MYWVAYRRKYGTLNQGRRLDVAIANLQANYFSSKIEKSDFTLNDFTLFEPEAEKPVQTLDEYMLENFA